MQIGCTHVIPNYANLLTPNPPRAELGIALETPLGIGEMPNVTPVGSRDYSLWTVPMDLSFHWIARPIHLSPSISPSGTGLGVGYILGEMNVTSLYVGLQFFTYQPILSLQTSQRLFVDRPLFVTYGYNIASFSTLNSESVDFLNFEKGALFGFHRLSMDIVGDRFAGSVYGCLTNQTPAGISGGIAFHISFTR